MEEKISEYDVLKKMFQDYAKISTVGGLVYLSLDDQHVLKKLFWGSVTSFFIALSFIWSYSFYNNWANSPVLTTIKSPGKFLNIFHQFFQISYKIWVYLVSPNLSSPNLGSPTTFRPILVRLMRFSPNAFFAQCARARAAPQG